MLTVPAHPSLTTSHDAALAHHRRYRPAEIRAMIDRHLHVVEDGSLFTVALAVRATKRLGEAVGVSLGSAGVGCWQHGSVVTQLATSALDLDVRTGESLRRRGVRLPGLSYWAVAERLPS